MVTVYGLADDFELDDAGMPIVIEALAQATKDGKITIADADHVISMAKLRIEHGDYPEATLNALDHLSFGDTTWKLPVIERLKTERPETKEAANQIIAAAYRAHLTPLWGFELPADLSAEELDLLEYACPVTFAFKIHVPLAAAVTVPTSLVASNTDTLLFASAVPLRVVSCLPGTASNMTGAGTATETSKP